MKRMNVLPQDLMKSRSCEILVETSQIALKFDKLKHLSSSAAELLVKFQSDTNTQSRGFETSHDLAV